MPVIPALGRLKEKDGLNPGDGNQPGQHRDSSSKGKKNRETFDLEVLF
jgi:hypothetical protein